MTAPGLRILAALHAGAVLVARPRGMVHVHGGKLTRGGRAVPASARPFCGVRTRRLHVIATTGVEIPAALSGRRFCRACTGRLPARLGVVDQVGCRDERVVAFGDLTVAELRLAASWCRTVDETHEVGTVLLQAHGPASVAPLARLSGAALELRLAHDAVNARRKELVARDRTPDEVAAIREARAAEAHNRSLVANNRRQAAAIERAGERARAGKYVMPHERELLGVT